MTHPLYENFDLPGMRPAAAVIACNKPCSRGEVLMFPPHRFAVAAVLTRDEFLKAVKDNEGYAARTAGAVTMHGPIAGEDHTRQAQPDPEQIYYYRLDYIGRMNQ